MLNEALLENFRNAAKLVADVMMQFDGDQWVCGNASLQVPWKIAYHIVDCLDYYFRAEPQKPYQWGHRFGGGWWEIEGDSIPNVDAVQLYLKDVEDRIERQLLELDDTDLALAYDADREFGESRLAHFIYALRHTMHHHGALSLLSLQLGNGEGIWL